MSERLLVWRRGQRPYRVRVSDVMVTTGLSVVGQLTALLPAQDVPRYPFGTDWKGLLARWDHPTAEAFGGEIVDDRPRSAERTIELVVESPASTLAARRLPATYLPPMGPGPKLIAGAIAAAGARRWLPIADVRVSAMGRAVTGEARAEDLLSYLQTIVDRAGCEWVDGIDDDGTWYLAVGPRLGRDQTHKVHLIENANCVEVTAHGSLRTVTNDLLAIGADRPYAAAAKVIVVNQASLAHAWGRREGTIRYSDLSHEASLEPAAVADVARLGIPPIAPELQMRADHPLVREIRRGDYVRLSSGTAGREYVVRVRTITVSERDNLLTLSGEAIVVDETRGWPWWRAG